MPVKLKINPGSEYGKTASIELDDKPLHVRSLTIQLNANEIPKAQIFMDVLPKEISPIEGWLFTESEKDEYLFLLRLHQKEVNDHHFSDQQGVR